MKTANADEDDKIEPPTDRDLDAEGFYDYKDKWVSEYMSIFKDVFVGAVIGLENDQSAGFTDS